ncbi:PIR Superfamily Protein [Plasmodium ovale wallikeri]|uniref:PIR Superfamily Protein n=1 Tax=Plasmodium ovale wallikeri TaxID=864142 RepID=A0A1A9ASL1_PLAOA|nr:PIR Superfamily Protein [Plasmodium ovale wallikeri]SBT59109.1 PIR Superfamily Protein [Plasmodium ovale wallikeri]
MIIKDITEKFTKAREAANNPTSTTTTATSTITTTSTTTTISTTTTTATTKPKYDPCDSFVKLDDKYAEKTYTFCKQIDRNVKKIYAMDKGINREQYCLHYKYWVYSRVYEIFASEADKIYNNGIIKKFNYLTATIMNGLIDYKCQYYFIGKNFNEIEMKMEKKNVYDFFSNYNYIKNRIISCVQEKVNEYEKYLTSIIKLYDKYKKDECNDYEDFLLNNCDDYFVFDEMYNPSILLSLLKICKDKKSVNDVDIKKVYESFGVSVNPENLKPVSTVSDVKFKCSEGFYWDGSEYQRGLICRDKQKGDIENNAETTKLKFSNLQIISNVFFAVTGITFISFLLYKFTPLGSKLHRRKKKKININSNFDDEHQFLSYDVESINIPTNNKRLRVAYHSR